MLVDNDTQAATGGKRRLQIIGITICAIVHQFRGVVAVDLLTEYLFPNLLEDS